MSINERVSSKFTTAGLTHVIPARVLGDQYSIQQSLGGEMANTLQMDRGCFRSDAVKLHPCAGFRDFLMDRMVTFILGMNPDEFRWGNFVRL